MLDEGQELVGDCERRIWMTGFGCNSSVASDESCFVPSPGRHGGPQLIGWLGVHIRRMASGFRDIEGCGFGRKACQTRRCYNIRQGAFLINLTRSLHSFLKRGNLWLVLLRREEWTKILSRMPLALVFFSFLLWPCTLHLWYAFLSRPHLEICFLYWFSLWVSC